MSHSRGSVRRATERPGERMQALLEDLELEAEPAATGPARAGDPFFTARVLGCLPAPLRGTGLRPTARTTLLVGVYLLAALLGYMLLSTVTPGLLEPLAHHAHRWLELGSDAVGTASLGGGLALVAIFAFLCCRSHTAAT